MPRASPGSNRERELNGHGHGSFAQDVRITGAAHPASRVLLDAHNTYPYGEWWGDRIDRALSTGVPLAVEQDLAWYRFSVILRDNAGPTVFSNAIYVAK
jgi:hypothetical protein